MFSRSKRIAVDVVIKRRIDPSRGDSALRGFAARTTTYPADWLLRRLAEHHRARAPNERPATTVKLTVWRTEFDPRTLLATEHTLRAFVYHVPDDRAAPLEWFRAAARLSHLEILLRLMAIACCAADGALVRQAVIPAAAALVLVFPRALRTPAVWAALGAGRGAHRRRLAARHNHTYLLAYWALAIALSLRAIDIVGALDESRWLSAWRSSSCCGVLLRRTFSTGGSFA
jgi:hypothetical protein